MHKVSTKLLAGKILLLGFKSSVTSGTSFDSSIGPSEYYQTNPKSP